MQPEYRNNNVTARCPDCGGAIATFEHRDSSREYGYVIVDKPHNYDNAQYARVMYKLLRCAGCGRGGLAKIHDTGRVIDGKLESFFPASIEHARLPAEVPSGIEAEFREAELCASSGAWRAASGLMRSTLEKLLRANGYVKGSLADRIDEAAADGVITEARRKRAHADVRVLGNDVLHDDWREVKPEEVHQSHHYVQRIAEDLYDDRVSVQAILLAKKRILAPAAP
jgi:hypothetical protein